MLKAKFLFFTRRVLDFLAIIIVFITLVTNINYFLFNGPGNDANKSPLPYEKYDSSLLHINSLEKLSKFISLEIKEKNLAGIDVPIFIDNFLRDRFFHNTNYIEHTNNWLLIFFDKLFPKMEFLGVMDPNEIIKSSYGSCNQQAILFQEIIKNYGFEFASVGLSAELKNNEAFGHFASVVKQKDQWFLFDTNLEPIYDRRNSEITRKLLGGDDKTLKYLYPNFDFKENSRFQISLMDKNSFPAKNGLLFQKITLFISNYLWIVMLFACYVIRKKI